MYDVVWVGVIRTWCGMYVCMKWYVWYNKIYKKYKISNQFFFYFEKFLNILCCMCTHTFSTIYSIYLLCIVNLTLHSTNVSSISFYRYVPLYIFLSLRSLVHICTLLHPFLFIFCALLMFLQSLVIVTFSRTHPYTILPYLLMNNIKIYNRC